jgi:lysophospholipase L1-like esterase
MQNRYPTKTALAVLTFLILSLIPLAVPSLRNYRSLEFSRVAGLFDFPLRKDSLPEDPGTGTGTPAKAVARKTPNLVEPSHALDHFYESLLMGGLDEDRATRILHYGDSPTTADLITADARAMLQREFGNAGSGFVLIARPWAWYQRRGVDMSASNWQIDIAGISKLKDGLNGLGGVSFVGETGATATWTMKNIPQQSVEIAYLGAPDGGEFTVETEGGEAGEKQIGTGQTASEKPAPGFVKFDIPDGARRLTLRVTKGTVRLFGADFRRTGPGVVYSSLGVNGANVTLLSHALNEDHWAAELRHYKPDLVIINYGTNESGFPGFVDSTWGRELRNAVKRVKAAVPQASILLMSPMDRGERNSAGDIETIATIPRLVKMESDIAQEMNVAFFNTYQAMGGEGTMARWFASEPRLVGADYIHPFPAGAKIVGELLVSALRDGFQKYKLQQLDRIAAASLAPQAAPAAIAPLSAEPVPTATEPSAKPAPQEVPSGAR